jgi:O-antigen/teichoic acid export membrane protein
VLASLSAAAVVVFAVVAGYEPVLVAGTALGGIGLVVMMLQLTYAVPLVSGLRLGSTAALDFLRQLLTVAGILLLVALGADLLGFFFLSIPVSVVVLAATIALLRREDRVAPHFDRVEVRYLVAEAAPAAAATVLASLFYRVAIVTMSLVATAAQTGYFGLSFRVSEVFIAVPWLIVSSAFPVLARAAETDLERLASAFRQMFDVCVILGVGSALVLVGGAEPIVGILGGSDFDPAVPVLRIQGLAVAATFLVTLFGAMLWIVRAKRPLVVGNLVGVGVAVALTVTLVSTASDQAEGAALAMLVAESLLALWLGVALLGTRPALRPSPRTAAKALVALLPAVAVLLLPVPPIVGVMVGSLVYAGALLALRAIHPDVWRATFRPNA